MSEMKMALAFKPIIECQKKNVIIPAGRDAGKTKGSVNLCALISMMNPDTDGLIARASYGSIGDTLYAETQEVIESTSSLNGLFRFYKSPLRMERNDGSGTIYFSGIGGANFSRTKGFKPTHPLSFVLIDETQELREERSLDEAMASYRRRMAPNAKTFYLGNPPPQEAHWFNKWVARKSHDPDFAVFKLSWEDVVPFLSDYDIREILKMKRDDPEYYRWFYMGDAVGGYGSVYPMLRKERQCITMLELEAIMAKMRIVACVIGGDGAVTHDCTAFSAGLIFENGQCVILTPFVHDPKVNGIMGYHVLVRDYVSKWFWDIVKTFRLGAPQGKDPSPLFREVPCFMTIDQAAPDLVSECRFFLSDRIDVNPTKKGTIMEMASAVQSALSNRMLFFLEEGKRFDYERGVDVAETNRAFDQLSLLTWNEKQTGYDEKVENDVADSATYLTRLWYSNPENDAFFRSLSQFKNPDLSIEAILGREK
jgi:Phage terminase large subunit